ncbi:uncharacterized protein LOC101861063 [Aplysia californica]|uniref:Uncharacterized protein LOC101861063 n=1 Tax=Aplysia californica TaxID=6500 RepID=A0ABM1A6F1_APLCA|nr:uncharacterized protein LOC101861063 [Aplysia californica]
MTVTFADEKPLSSVHECGSSTAGCQHCSSCSYLELPVHQQTKELKSRSHPHKSPLRFIMAYKGRIVRLSILVLFSFMFCGVYLAFFKHPPPDVLLQMNMQSQDSDLSFNDFGASSFQKSNVQNSDDDEGDTDDAENVEFFLNKRSVNDDEGDEEENEEEEDEYGEKLIVKSEKMEKREKNEKKEKQEKKEKVESKHSEDNNGAEYWKQFLKVNKFVPIGAVFDKCEGDDRLQIGTVVLQADKALGGVKSVTFFNHTFKEEIAGGQFHIEVKYNGQDLYDNYWELCELEDDLPEKNRTFTCPIQAKHWTVVKEKHVPGYLPTGRFQTKAWAVDESENVLACGYADFKI